MASSFTFSMPARVWKAMIDLAAKASDRVYIDATGGSTLRLWAAADDWEFVVDVSNSVEGPPAPYVFSVMTKAAKESAFVLIKDVDADPLMFTVTRSGKDWTADAQRPSACSEWGFPVSRDGGSRKPPVRNPDSAITSWTLGAMDLDYISAVLAVDKVTFSIAESLLSISAGSFEQTLNAKARGGRIPGKATSIDVDSGSKFNKLQLSKFIRGTKKEKDDATMTYAIHEDSDAMGVRRLALSLGTQSKKNDTTSFGISVSLVMEESSPSAAGGSGGDADSTA